MRALIESTFVTLGGDIGAPQEWGPPFLSDGEIDAVLHELLFEADALVLGRLTYEGLSAGYQRMAGEAGPMAGFVDRMNAIGKYVASRTLTKLDWNAELLGPDVAARVAELKQQPGGYLLKYGTGPFDATLAAHRLVDEYRIWVIPATDPPGQRLFDEVGSMSLRLTGSRTFSTGVVLLTYAPA
jgi:dihydrofolate reductase